MSAGTWRKLALLGVLFSFAAGCKRSSPGSAAEKASEDEQTASEEDDVKLDELESELLAEDEPVAQRDEKAAQGGEPARRDSDGEEEKIR